jgi:[ribosomal protein S5]-alanine N-acetyltransferase
MQNVINTNITTGFPPLLRWKSNMTNKPVEHQLRTNRLYMRPVSADDFHDYLLLFSDPSVMKFIGIEAGYVPKYEEIEQMFQGALEAWEIRGYGRWSMFDSETLEFAGFCGFRCENGTPELITALHERYWGRGLAAEAASACIKYGFKSLGFTSINAFTRPSHIRARKTLKKLGAEFDGYTDFHGVTGASYHFNLEDFQAVEELLI